MVFKLFLHNPSFLESVGANCPHKALMSKNKKSLHVRRSTIFSLNIDEERKKYLHAARSLPSSSVEEFFYDFYKISLFVKVFERSLNRYVANNSEFISTNSPQFRNSYLKPDSLFHLILFK